MTNQGLTYKCRDTTSGVEAAAWGPGVATQASSLKPQAAHGLSLVELLIALSISAMLLTAVAMAINASFYAYASAAESASTQSVSRIVMQRLMIMIRTTSLHDAYDPDDPAVALGDPINPPVHAVGMRMVDLDGRLLRIWWRVNAEYADADLGDLWYQLDASVAQPMLERVRVQRTASAKPYVFTLVSRSSEDGLLLKRATVDLTVEPGADATLPLETYRGAADPVRLIASAAPRKNLE